jgi:hypothetical protein
MTRQQQSGARYWFDVAVRGRDIVVTHPPASFTAVYYKPASELQLILRHRTRCDDHALMAHARQAANDKARELGWIN